MPWPQRLAVSEQGESVCNVVLTILEIFTTIAAIVLAAVALRHSVRSLNVTLKTNFNSTQEAIENQATGKTSACISVHEDQAFCFGLDYGNIFISVGLLQLSCSVFVIMVLRVVLSCLAVGREVTKSKQG